ncbi:MAG: hypothetical protein HOO06_14815 [Bdellovibrionaceae bacterium]|jgi:hypothetical protein|nr:hypothetical protein [Pseudobdellovibrionaceae bacterium]
MVCRESSSQIKHIQLCVVVGISLFFISCSDPESGKKDEGSGGNGIISTCDRVSPVVDGPAEKSYCSTSQIYTGVTISGKAEFVPRIVGGGSAGLLGPDSPLPIRKAEIEVLDENGNSVQCGETDDNGQFSLELPTGSSNVTLHIRSRGVNSNVNASVMKCPEENIPYSIQTSFTPNSSKSLGTVSAAYNGDTLGGAFNIYDQILKSNEYLTLKTVTDSCSGTYSNCSNFSPSTHKLNVYWEKGFNPGAYSGSTSGTSFYIPGTGRLFILGGVNMDTDSSDTDHFDNSVIVHEYAHFLEDKYSVSDSPGGSHSGNALIDPRLAWSEGFANFFQAAVSSSPYYIDTSGNIDGTTSSFSVDLENQSSSGSGVYALDIPQMAEEGNFREFSVTRFLMDIVDNTPTEASSTEIISDKFIEIWATMTGTDGFVASSRSFRSIGLLHADRKNIVETENIGGYEDWSPLRTIEDHNIGRNNYAQALKSDGSCTSYLVGGINLTPQIISARDDGSLDHGFSTSHLLINNDYYYYSHTGGNLKIDLRYKTDSGTEADFDLFIYNESARLGNYDDIQNDLTNNEGINEPDADIATAESESVSLSSLPAGNYLINVMNYTGTGSTTSTDYDLKINDGANFSCPDI